MSNQINTNLLERAAEMVDQWEGTIIAREIEADLERNDLEGLRAHVSEAEAMTAQEETHAYDVY